VVAPPTGTPQSSCPSGAVAGDIATVYTGRATAVFDEGNGTQAVERISQSDALGRLTSVCEVSSATLVGQNAAPASCGLDIGGTGFLTTYAYDALNNLLQVNQGTMTPRTFTYDSLSRPLCASNPENSSAACPATPSSSYTTGTTGYAYDANGNLITKTAPAPNQTGTATVTTTYTYDALNRLTQKSYSDGTTPTATFVYDAANPPAPAAYGWSIPNPIGRLVEASVGCAFTVNWYDVMGRITQQIQQTPLLCDYYYVIPYSYDLAGDMTSAGDGYFSTYTYGYNSAGRLTSLTGALSAQKYTAFGAVASDTLGDTETESYTYDKRLRLQSATSSYNGTPTYSYSLTFAPNGDVIAANDSVNGNWNYAYDAFNRLTCSNLVSNGTCAAPTNGTPTYSYTYDRFGNRWNQTGAQTFNATFTGNNPGNPQNNNRLDGYSYDSAGNLLSDKTHNYFYDAENRLIQVDGTLGTCSSATACYSYDALGRRVSRTGYTDDTCDSTGVRGYVYDLSDRMILETIPDEMGCHYEIYAGGRHLGSYRGEMIYSHTDWLGTERVRIDSGNASNRALDQHCSSLPFGDGMSPCDGEYSSTLHFTGKERDSESGLDNFDARYLGSSLGRFMSPDPDQIDGFDHMESPQAWNGYAYVHNNPLNATDPDGLDCIYMDENGKYTGFNRGDCDNSTEAKANSGYYVNGNVDTITLNGQGQVTGYSGTGDAPGSMISGSFLPSAPSSSDPDQLSPFAQGVLSQPVLKNAAGVVNAAGMAEYRAAGFIFPLSTLLIDLAANTGSSGTSAAQAGLRRKPGSLGEFKGADALRKENKMARDIMKELNLGEDMKGLVHEALSEGAIDAGRKLTFKEGVNAVLAVLGRLPK
jgi:RHS repeat-associated protein